MKTFVLFAAGLVLISIGVPTLSGVSVAVFDDTTYVDSSNTSQAESDNIQASLSFLGHTVSTFTDFMTGIGGQSVVVIPELENNELAPALSASSRTTLQNFISTGGTLVINGSYQVPGWAANLINTLLGTSLLEQQEPTGALFDRHAQAAQTPFEDDPPTLAAMNGSDSLFASTLPPDARIIYGNGSSVLVAVFPYGSGQVVFLGWDWYDAAPVGTQNGGWLQVLGSTVSFDGPPRITRQPQSQSAAAGERVSFDVGVSSGSPLTYQWLRNDVPIPGATDATLDLGEIEPDDFARYAVIASNHLGTIRSASAVLAPLSDPVQFFNATVLQIPRSDTMGPAAPYPSVLSVSGFNGIIGRIEVTLNKLTHTFPGDLDILLVSPSGRKVMLMSDAGGNLDVANLSLTFSDFADDSVPSDLFTDGVYRPTDVDSGETLAAPAPAGPYATALSNFRHTNPNGNWLLYVEDDAGADLGSLAGWSLTIYPESSFNDQFDNRTELTDRSIRTTNNNSVATRESGEPIHAGKTGGRSVWWTWVCGTDGSVSIDTFGSSFDTLLAIYTGNSISNLTEVASNDDTGGLQSRVTFAGIPGEAYHIAVDGYNGAHGTIVLNVVADNPTPLVIACPPDDAFSNLGEFPTPDPNSVAVLSSCGPVTRRFLGESHSSSGCRTTYVRTYQVTDSCGQIRICTQTITARQLPRLLGFDTSQRIHPNGIEVIICANVLFADSFQWTVESGNPISTFEFDNCISLVVNATNEEPIEVRVLALNDCGTAGAFAPTVTSCAICLSRGSPSLITSTEGSGFGPPLNTGQCGSLSTAARWFKLVASDTGVITVSTEGSSYDTMLAVYTGPLTQLVPVGCNENISSLIRQSRLAFNATNGLVYWIAVEPRTTASTLRLAAGFEPKIESYGLRPDGSFELQSSRAPAISYRLEATTTITGNWSTVLTSNLIPTSPYLLYREPSPRNFRQRFYRIRPGP